MLNKALKASLLSSTATMILGAGTALAQTGDNGQAPDDVGLEEIVVIGSQPEFFRASDASSAARFDLPIDKTPQSISVMTEDFLRIANIDSLEDASRYVPGLTEQGLNGYGEPRTNFTFRGQKLDLSNNFKLNNYSFAFQGLMETVGIERIEFVRGPASIGYGVTSYGGTVNVVTKKPLDEFFAAARLGYGSYGTYRMEGDVTGPLTEDGRLKFRLGVGYRSGGSFRDGERSDILTAVSTLVFDATENLRISLDGYFQEAGNLAGGSMPVLEDADGNYVFPTDDVLPRSTFTGNTRFNNSDNELRAIVLKAQHQLNDTTEITAVANYSSSNLEVRSAYADAFFSAVSMDPTSENYGIIPVLAQDLRDLDEFYNAEVSVQKTFEAFGQEHTFFALGGYNKQESVGGYATACNSRINIFDFHNDEILTTLFTEDDAENGIWPFCFGSTRILEIENRNIGAQANLNITDKLNVLLGLRYDSINQYYLSAANAALTKEGIERTGTPISDFRTDELTFRIGAVYEFLPDMNVYAMFVDGFTPQAEPMRDGGVTPNEQGKLYELGAKTLFQDGDLGINAAVFLLKIANTAVSDPANVPGDDFSLSAGKAKQWGFEIEAIGQVTDSLAVSANYAYQKGEVTANPEIPALVGLELRGGPNHTASLLVNYTFDRDDALDGLNLGASVTYASSQPPRNLNPFGDPAFVPYIIPGYTTADFNASYPVSDSLEVGLNVHNIFDKDYVLPSGSPWGVNYGEPRSFMVYMRMAM